MRSTQGPDTLAQDQNYSILTDFSCNAPPVHTFGVKDGHGVDASGRSPMPLDTCRSCCGVKTFHLVPILLQKSQLDLRWTDAQHTPKMGFLAPTS